MVPFADELELVKKYISVGKVRFEERIDVQYDIDPDSLQVLFPPFILQTLVENAIKHGVNKRKDGGLVAITTSVKDQELHVEIRNTGDLEMKKNTGYGLRNTQERIRLLFDDKASFSLTAADNMVYARLKIPINKSE